MDRTLRSSRTRRTPQGWETFDLTTLAPLTNGDSNVDHLKGWEYSWVTSDHQVASVPALAWYFVEHQPYFALSGPAGWTVAALPTGYQTSTGAAHDDVRDLAYPTSWMGSSLLEIGGF